MSFGDWKDMLDNKERPVLGEGERIVVRDSVTKKNVDEIIDELEEISKDPEYITMIRALTVAIQGGTYPPVEVLRDAARLGLFYMGALIFANDEQRKRFTPAMNELVMAFGYAMCVAQLNQPAAQNKQPVVQVTPGEPVAPGKVRIVVESTDHPEVNRMADCDGGVVVMVNAGQDKAHAMEGEAACALAVVGGMKAAQLGLATLLSYLEEQGVDTVKLAGAARSAMRNGALRKGDIGEIH